MDVGDEILQDVDGLDGSSDEILQVDQGYQESETSIEI